MKRFLLEFYNFASFTFWNLSSAKFSLRNSIFALESKTWKSSIFKPNLQTSEIAIMKKNDFKSFDFKIISGKDF